MKIYYTTDEINENACKQSCPMDMKFSKYDTIAGVGSWSCTHDCPYCYGRSRNFSHLALFATSDGSDKPFVLRTENYVKCAGVYSSTKWYTKMYMFLYKYIGKHIMDLIDKIDRHV